MEINPATTAGGAGAAKPGASEAAESGTAARSATGAVTGDFETFLTLLTTQMRNQDPLKPMDSTEFVAQLASFSAVEQQIRSNERLQGILDVLSGGSPAGLAEWIGREVRVAAKADFAGVPVEVAVASAEGADKAVLVVRNDFGNEVARLAVAADATEATWDGKDAMGATVAHGSYGFTLESWAGDTLLGTSEGKVFARVQEVRVVDGAPMLVVEGGAQVPLDEVGGVR
jgi:flagellar basal-body rod modification protein FlgD